MSTSTEAAFVKMFNQQRETSEGLMIFMLLGTAALETAKVSS